jgi:hypothetical protein
MQQGFGFEHLRLRPQASELRTQNSVFYVELVKFNAAL